MLPAAHQHPEPAGTLKKGGEHPSLVNRREMRELVRISKAMAQSARWNPRL